MKRSSKEGRFITKEFGDFLTGKTPCPYLRLHDTPQRMLAERRAALSGQSLAETAYIDRMIHFWREVSLAEMPRSGKGMDECYALLFESAFDLAEAEPDWALECLEEKPRSQWAWEPLSHLARANIGNPINHAGMTQGFASLYAPWRERDQDWQNECVVVSNGSGWFWAALLAATGVPEDHRLWNFRCALAQSSSTRWDDPRLHIRLIREAPQKAESTAKIELMDHPLMRMARLKYVKGSVEQNLVNRFLNHRCIKEGFQSEEDCFTSDVTLAQWLRDARTWAADFLEGEPETCATMFDAAGVKAIEAVRQLFLSELGSHPEQVDDLDATASLMRWAKRRRGFPYSSYRAQRWEFIVDIVDAALWLGWLFPKDEQVGSCLEEPRAIMKRFKGIDYDFRPRSYWEDTDELAALLRNVKGTNRRQMIRDYWEAGKIDELSEELLYGFTRR